ncbi:MAG: FtsX-like permease family protein [Candidatus Hodarchaeales archaeon]
MSIEDREFQTGVMRAVGESRRGIFQAMLIETLFQGIMGGIFGLIGGLLFGQAVAMYLASLFGTGRLSVQPVINQEVMVLSVIIGVLIGIVTGLLPALRASRVNIVNALRGIKVAYEEKSSRNFAFFGVFLTFIGCLFLLSNGFLNEDLQYIWLQEGWNSLDEWRNILLGAGFLFTGYYQSTLTGSRLLTLLRSFFGLPRLFCTWLQWVMVGLVTFQAFPWMS